MSEKLLLQILSEVQGVQAEVKDIKTDILGIQMKQEEFSEWKDEISVSIESLALHVNTLIQDVNEIKDNQLRHDKVLATLSVRSFEHDEEIRRLKQES